jgi:hypothetical protein
MSWRPILGPDRAPVQQGLTTDPKDYTHYKINTMMLGVILEVYPADSKSNRTAHQSEEERGFYHEAKVLLVNTNSGSNLIVDHVVICPSVNTGLDNYYEHLPRPTRNRVDGADMPSDGSQVDPYDLDGDWCVVGFLGGSLEQPFIVTWWPHPRNSFDPATSGNGNQGESLVQDERYFTRVNGVEKVITEGGDIYLSTKYANSNITFDTPDVFRPGGEGTPGVQVPRSKKGRWVRTIDEDKGGSVLVEIKPSQTVELSWDEPIDGAGILRGNEAELPQTNPPPTKRQNASTIQREEMYVLVDRDTFRVDASDVKLNVGNRVRIICRDETTICSTNVINIESKQVAIDGTEVIEVTSPSVTIFGDDEIKLESDTLIDLESNDEVSIVANNNASLLSTTADANVSGIRVILGGGSDALIKGTALNSAWNGTTIGGKINILAMTPTPTTVGGAAPGLDSVILILKEMIAALGANLSDISFTE